MRILSVICICITAIFNLQAQKVKPVLYLGGDVSTGYSINHELPGFGYFPTLSLKFKTISLEYSIGQMGFRGNPSNFSYSSRDESVSQTYYTLDRGYRFIFFSGPQPSAWEDFNTNAAVDHSTVLVNRIRIVYEVANRKKLSLHALAGISYQHFRDLTVGAYYGIRKPSNRDRFFELAVPVDLQYHTWQPEMGLRGSWAFHERLALDLNAYLSSNFRWSNQVYLGLAVRIKL